MGGCFGVRRLLCFFWEVLILIPEVRQFVSVATSVRPCFFLCKRQCRKGHPPHCQKMLHFPGVPVSVNMCHDLNYTALL